MLSQNLESKLWYQLKSPRGGWIGDNANQCTIKIYDATITQNKTRSRIPREGLWTDQKTTNSLLKNLFPLQKPYRIIYKIEAQGFVSDIKIEERF